MRKLLTFLIVCATLGGSLTAQVTSVSHEVFSVDGAGAGITTYRIYADLQDANDFLSSVYAAGDDALVIGGDDGTLYNDGAGSTTGDALAIGFCMFVPTLCFDSFVTIGWYGTNDYQGNTIACGQSTTVISSLPSPSVIPDAFLAPGFVPNLSMADGAWFTPNLAGCNDNGFGIGASNRVLIAQVAIATGTDLVYNLNIQVFDAADGTQPIVTVGDCNTANGLDVDGSGLGLHYPVDSGCVASDGCTDSAACNYDSTAGSDDGTCEFLSCAGCADSAACNYDSTATIDDGSCCLENCVTITVGGDAYDSEISWALTDALGNVVLSGGAPEVVTGCVADDCYEFVMNDSFGDGWGTATYSIADFDGNIIYSGTLLGGSDGSDGTGLPGACGCTTSTACNYDSAAVLDDGSCIALESNDDCADAIGLSVDGVSTLVVNDCSSPDGGVGLSWFDGSVENDVWYSFTAPSSGGVLTIETSDDGTDTFNDTQLAVYDVCGGTILADDDDAGDGLYSLLTFDCDAATGLVEGNTYVIQVDGFLGQSGTCNITLTFTDKLGCTDTTFDNYDACASADDGSCLNGISGCMDTTACNYDSLANADDGSCTYPGCDVSSACNYDSLAGCDDGSCTYPGCDDSSASNYDSTAGCDDGSCCFGNVITFELIDGFGDGWNGAIYDVVDAATSLSVASGTLSGGSFQADDLCLADGCYTVSVGGGSYDSEISWNILGADAPAGGGAGTGSFSVNTASCFGCQSSTACNYDSAATYDDGSCIFAPCTGNDEPAGATALSMEVLGVCNTITDDLSVAQSDNVEGTAFTLGFSADLWYEFTAVTAGVRVEVSSAGGFDAVVEIIGEDIEDVSFGTDEYLNLGGLTPGLTYQISVSAYDGTPLAGDGEFDICVQYLPETTCDYGSGPYNLCDIFKADWVGDGVYTFNFTAVSDGAVYTAIGDPLDFIQLFDVPGLPWGDDYTVVIDIAHNLQDVNGFQDQPFVDGTISCPITLSAPPVSVVKSADNCANFGPKWLGQYIGSTPWVCGAVDWEWEFTRTDIAELAIVHLGGTAVNYVRLSNVAGLVEGGVYDVRVRAVFPNGATGAYGAPECVSIVGPITLPNVDGPTVELLDEQKDLSDAIVAPEAAIYPNPNNGQILNVNLSGVESTVVTMDIIDMFGKTVQAEQITVSTGNVNEVINLNGLASGVYVVRITMGDITQTERLVIEK
ncbi:MAG: hypothetical protein ACI84C_000151 [Flavobacteriales bacterium]|jgi:hypothetical protein